MRKKGGEKGGRYTNRGRSVGRRKEKDLIGSGRSENESGSVVVESSGRNLLTRDWEAGLSDEEGKEKKETSSKY